MANPGTKPARRREPKIFPTYSSFLRERFGRRVRKIPVDGGFTCPNRDGSRGRGGCIFCDNRAFSPAAGRGSSVSSQLSRGQPAQGRQARAFIAYFQPFTGTYAPVARLRQLFEEAIRFPEVVGVAVATRPDCLPEPILDYLQELGEKTFLSVELGIQTLEDQTLKFIRRGHRARESLQAMEALSSRGLSWTAHLILGLPGETEREMKRSAAEVCARGPAGLKFHQLMVIRQTDLERLWRQGTVRTLELEEYAGILGDILEETPPTLVIHRLAADCRPDRGLLAPAWSAQKTRARDFILRELARRGILFLNSGLSSTGA